MRKVTASAVILTAITGCGQNGGIPSTQWSFKIPSAESITGAQVANTQAQDAQVAGTQTQAFHRSITSDLSTEAKAFVGTANAEMMGPAFGQPSEVAGNVSDQLRPYSSRSVSGIQPSTRPDPVAEVRAYLQASGNPSALTGSTPYSSQVYLSSLPTAPQTTAAQTTAQPATTQAYVAPYVSPAAPIVATLPPVDAAPATFSAFSNGNQAVDVSSNASGNLANDASLSAYESAYGSAAYTEAAPVTASNLPTLQPSAIPGSGAVATDYASTEAPAAIDDGLPVLQPAPAANLTATTASETVIPTDEASSSEEVSIGTAILRDLRRSAASESAADSAIEAPAAVTQPSAPAPSAQVSAESAPAVAVRETLVESAAPSLQNLLRSLPQREALPAAEAGASSPILETSSLETSNLETSFDSDAYSPLLSGLRGSSSSSSSALSTIYVPIAASVPADGSITLVQGVIAALGNEASTAALVSEMALQETVSSVLNSSALLNKQTSRPEPAAKASRDHRASDRPLVKRQRIAWLQQDLVQQD
jgi:hypothetical protein